MALAIPAGVSLAAGKNSCPVSGMCVSSDRVCGTDPTWEPNSVRFDLCAGMRDDINPDLRWKTCYVDGGNYCKPISAEEVAKRKQQREAAAAIERERAERVQKHESDVAAEIARLGAHRAAEARNIVEMREKAEAARPKWTGDRKPGKRKVCKIPASTGKMFEQRENLESEARRLCGSRYQGFAITECKQVAGWCHATYRCGEGESENACPGSSGSSQ